jgi:hypothetical protein
MKRLFAGAFGCLLVLGIAIWLYQSQNGKKTNQNTPSKWTIGYRPAHSWRSIDVAGFRHAIGHQWSSRNGKS